MNQIREMLLSRARDLAAHDGAPVSSVYMHAAANSLVAEVMRERDSFVDPPAPITAAAEPKKASAASSVKPAPVSPASASFGKK